MPSILLRVQLIDNHLPQRPLSCPYCGSQILQRWGQVKKSILDTEAFESNISRYRCYDCQRTFRRYPAGVDRAGHSQRIRNLAALSCALGMSCREVGEVFSQLGVPLSRMTVWRDAQELVNRLEMQGQADLLKRYTIDRAYVPNVSRKLGVVLVLNVGAGKPFILGTLDDFNPQSVKAWLEQLVADPSIEITLMGTDMLNRISI